MSNVERVEMDVCNKFWTRQNEMIDELEEMDYVVTAATWEYVVVSDALDDDAEYILYIGHANTTMWVERVLEG